ncbi:TonB-dependent receptor [Indibacter alkaliphilus LW1]|uniref:TonB-dependent receptor n=1 Tax=Indibacter alkaliphilus (strain CCUG 57479 / KCTC 22604 / LW1) TaxID=1189612 RepID=S2DQ36_INDAL|nr:SusC/RagA family TonB-linked outer membrane protein [Indibacter alkaliphilus]EOZ91938.1 TonB-dependent receptor [Indibacter alkaliphilus LW1]
MKKALLKKLPLGLFILALALVPLASQAQLKGTVLTMPNRQELPGAVIMIRPSDRSAISDAQGEFSISLEEGIHTLTVSYLGFKTYTLQLDYPQTNELTIILEPDQMDLGEVEVVTTGYHEIPKERATGSFVKVGQELVDRRISTNILERLEDVTSGLIFNRNSPNTDPLSIRGRSTLFGNSFPLIVIDNLPYEGPLENINPNDVESVTVLRDAAAASIWGAQAGNGVIIITTKKGKMDMPLKVSFNSNVNVIEPQDLFYQPLMDIGDFVNHERGLFEANYYNAQINAPSRQPLSPVVETMLAERNGLISQSERDAALATFSQQDRREQLRDFYYRPAVNQQYALQLTGGGKNHNYAFSAGYDRNGSDVIDNTFERITLTAKNSWSAFSNRLEISTGIAYSKTADRSGTSVPNILHPYEALRDANGNNLAVVSAINTRFRDQMQGSGLLDWSFRPLDEIGMVNSRTGSDDFRINLGTNYKIIEGLNAQVLYQLWRNNLSSSNLQEEELFTMRNLINSFTQVAEDGSLSRPVPLGSRLYTTKRESFSHNLRGQLNYSRKFQIGELAALGGWEMRDRQSLQDRMSYYGYNDRLGISTPIDHVTLFPQFQNPGSRQAIPYGGLHSGDIDRFVSYFANASYTLQDKYTLTMSGRRDMSNLFGVNANQRGVPLWSVGGSWLISNESFFNWDYMPFLKLRTTYGYNGNVDRFSSALTTMRYTTFNMIIPGLPYGFINTPPNPDLRWERIKITNFGLDFENKSGRLSGNIEFYTKTGVDLIGESLIPESNGLMNFRGNFSSTRTMGWDITLNTLNLDRGIRWNTQYLISFVNDKVLSFDGSRSVGQYIGSASTSVMPMEGNPLFAVYSYGWQGLHPDTGDPMGLFEGEASTNYAGIINSFTPETLYYHGPARPTAFGSVRNDFMYKALGISFNLSYRFGHYYRRRSVNYMDLNRGMITHGDFSERWQQPGDEAITNVPSLPVGLNNARHLFYQGSGSLIESADNIRLQDIRLSYRPGTGLPKNSPLSGAEIYCYVNNVGILWKATNERIDPEFQTMRPLRSVALGVRFDL